MKPRSLSILRATLLAGALVLILVSLLATNGCMQAHSEETDTPVASASAPYVQATDPVAAGRYLVQVGGCNDCHTAGYAESNGNLPESEWLTGVPVGFRGPWGTSYPSNLRLRVQDLTEDAWVTMAHTREALPPMPWPSLNHMHENDVRAIYQYIHSLGPKGEPMPVAVGPDQEPATPYFDFEPQHMERLQAMSASVPSAPASVQ